MKTIGQKIHDRRKELKMTLQEIGDKTDTSKAYMWEIENKKNGRPSAEKLNKIALALDVPISYLLDENQSAPKFSEAEELFLTHYRKLPDSKKESLFKIMKIL